MSKYKYKINASENRENQAHREEQKHQQEHNHLMMYSVFLMLTFETLMIVTISNGLSMNK